ncbi:MAG: TetR/AcrR family transcriptional regulator [Acidimicrobiales bacterium]
MSEPDTDITAFRRWAAKPSVRREGNHEYPPGPKARRTRSRVLAAAARTFETNGYQRTTMADVAAAAGVSLGTVYQYFRDRTDIVAALVGDNVDRMLERTNTVWQASEGIEGLRRVIGNFIDSYAAVAPMAGVWEEVCHIDETMAELRRSFNRLFIGSVERELARAAANGLVRNDLDHAIAARALTAMVDRYCYVTHVLDPPAGGPPSPQDSTEVLTRLWAAAVGLSLDGGPSHMTSQHGM